MGKKTILFDFPAVFPNDESDRAKLREIASGCELIFSDGREPDAETAGRLNAIVGAPSDELLKKTEKLEWLQLLSAGADRYVRPGLLPGGAVLTNATGAYGKSIAEYMLCAVMSLFLDFPHYRDNQRRHVWENSGKTRHIPGTTALVVGLGNLGSEFAMRYKALGGHVIGVKRTASAGKPEYLDGLYTTDRLDELLPRADVVTLSLPSTPATRHLFGRQKFGLMKPGAVLVNVGRGTAVDTGALCDALNAGKLSGAALDVTDPEPLPADHPIWDAPNVIITPHVSGGWDTPENAERVFSIIYENLGRYLRGEELVNVVDLKTGYRKHG